MYTDPVLTLRCSFNLTDGFPSGVLTASVAEEEQNSLPESEADERLDRASELDGGHGMEVRE
jgi:hypothetical protein